jgi:stage V sporulation protein D (sporulation-specific penicillin-binding protein)
MPADDPEIILLVLADMPDKKIGYYGSTVAVPTVRDILTDVLPYLGFSPEYSDDELENLDVKVPLLEGDLESAKKTLEDQNINYEVIGTGTTVIAQSPVTSSMISKEGTVYLYTEPSHIVDYTEVPNLIGLTPSMVNDNVAYSQLNYVAKGASVRRDGAVVASQKPEPGKKIAVGEVIEVEFIVNSDGD